MFWVRGPEAAKQRSGGGETPLSCPPRALPSGYGRIGSGLRLHHLLLIAFTMIAAVPIAVLALWEYHTDFQAELASAHERHLLVARNLTSILSRYVKDVEAVFGLALDSGAPSHAVAGISDVLMSLNVVNISLIAPDGTTYASMPGLSGTHADMLPAPVLADIRLLAASADGHIAISPLQHDISGRPVFYLVKQLPDGRIGVGIVTTTYLASLLQALALGDHDHAVIVDAKGQVIAHSFKDWVAASDDIAGIPVLAAMMRGETSAGQFYVPELHDSMIAGYAVVPETGWGVIVSQPMSALRRAGPVNKMVAVTAVASFFAAALIAHLLARAFSRSLRTIGATAEAVLEGNDQIAVPVFHGLVPYEIRRLGVDFNTMLDRLRHRAGQIGQPPQRAETSNTAKSQFLANMSHEIRTPLHGVIGMIELLRMTDLSAAQRRHAEMATHSSQSLLRLIDDILDLSRIEVGGLKLELAPFHLPSLIHDVRMVFADQARSKGLTVLTSIPDTLDMMVIGDKRRISRILTNLVSNALRFTTEGTITLRGQVDQRAGQARQIRLEVSDTGVGISASKQALIFDAFTQADSAMTHRHDGTGLGLSIARQLCQMMKGDIGVESVVGVGSTFWFTVVLDQQADTLAEPIARSRPAGPDFSRAVENAGLGVLSVLLVEDNAANMVVTKALLEALGCRVTPARNGLEAVASYRDHEYDLVLMDCQMPDMDGYQATSAIREIESVQHRYTPIIALTAHAMEGSLEASVASGMDDQITKPLTMAALTSKLLEWLVPVKVPSQAMKSRIAVAPQPSYP